MGIRIGSEWRGQPSNRDGAAHGVCSHLTCILSARRPGCGPPCRFSLRSGPRASNCCLSSPMHWTTSCASTGLTRVHPWTPVPRNVTRALQTPANSSRQQRLVHTRDLLLLQRDRVRAVRDLSGPASCADPHLAGRGIAL